MKRKMRRKFIKIIGFSFFSLIFQPVAFLYSQTKKLINPNLSDKQKSIMFKEATERPFSSPLNNEKRQGYYHCANCGAKLFSSSAKFDSGTGWPSFTESLPGAFKTKIDYSYGIKRTEIIVQIAVYIMATFLMTDHPHHKKDFVIMAYV